MTIEYHARIWSTLEEAIEDYEYFTKHGYFGISNRESLTIYYVSPLKCVAVLFMSSEDADRVLIEREFKSVVGYAWDCQHCGNEHRWVVPFKDCEYQCEVCGEEYYSDWEE